MVQAPLLGQFSCQKTRNEETEKGRDRCRDRGQGERAQERQDDGEGDTREDRGPAERWYYAFRIDDPTLRGTVG